MPRNRSRSRSRERRRSRSPRERGGRHRETHKRNRSRSPRHRSPPGAGGSRRRSTSHSPRRRSRSRERYEDRKGHASKPDRPKIDESQLVGMSEEEADMMRTMGFAGFDTTKGKKVENNDIYVAKLTQKRRYRQYMNRRGGFNRPLDFIA